MHPLDERANRRIAVWLYGSDLFVKPFPVIPWTASDVLEGLRAVIRSGRHGASTGLVGEPPPGWIKRTLMRDGEVPPASLYRNINRKTLRLKAKA